MDLSTVPLETQSPQEMPSRVWAGWPILEFLLLVGLFAAYAGQAAPGVNESHYLTKAKQFWSPEWCGDDLFVASSRPHLLFYMTVGWLTVFLPLPAVAWIGRLVVWSLMAVSWQRLSNVILGRHLAILSATLFVTLSHQCHLAGEWVIGGVESKGFAFPFVFWALAAMAEGRWSRVWIFVGIASAFHVLVGGWSCLAALGVFAYQRLSQPEGTAGSEFGLLNQAVPLVFGGLIALVGILPPLIANWGTEPDVIREANSIMVTERLSHHQLFGDFSTTRVAWFLGLAFCWIIALRIPLPTIKQNQINQFCVAALVIAVLGVFLSAAAENDPMSFAVDLLIWYWFRLSDVALPLAATMTLILIGKTVDSQADSGWVSKIPVVSGLLILIAFGSICNDRWTDPRPVACQRSLIDYPGQPKRTWEAFQNWVKACRWIRENTSEDAQFLTPAQQQTFKWYAHRAEVVSWKDVPQEASGILKWKERVNQFSRVQLAYPSGLWAYTDDQLFDLARKYNATHLMTLQSDLESRPGPPPEFRQIYPENPQTKATFVIFELRAIDR